MASIRDGKPTPDRRLRKGYREVQLELPLPAPAKKRKSKKVLVKS